VAVYDSAVGWIACYVTGYRGRTYPALIILAPDADAYNGKPLLLTDSRQIVPVLNVWGAEQADALSRYIFYRGRSRRQTFVYGICRGIAAKPVITIGVVGEFVAGVVNRFRLRLIAADILPD